MKNFRYMLKNASLIAYYQNMLLEKKVWHEENFYLNEGYAIEKGVLEIVIDRGVKKFAIVISNDYGDSRWVIVPEKIWKFLAKGRKLRSALATPMARHYGYKYIEKTKNI